MKYYNRTWNPTLGCSPCSEGCENCFARELVEKRKKCEKNLTFDIRENKKQLMSSFESGEETIFVSGQSDLFHPSISERYLDKVFRKMNEAKEKHFLILTKRSSLLKDYFENPCLFDNVGYLDFERMMFGVTVETNIRKKRIDDLLMTDKIKYRFISLEPMLEKISIEEYLKTGLINWIVVGCETGENRRNCEISWIKDVIEECKHYNIPVFVNKVNINGEITENLPYEVNKREFFKDFKIY